MSSVKANLPILIVDDNQDIHADFDKVLCPKPTSALAFGELEADLFGTAAPEVVSNSRLLIHANSGEEAAQITRKELALGRRFAMAFVDMRMPPGWDGLRTMEELKKIDNSLPFVVCSAYSDFTQDQVCERLEIRSGILFMRKPFSADDVRSIATRFSRA